MKWLKNRFLIIGALMIVGVLSGIWLGSDNPVEQIVENVIFANGGGEIDLSPEA